MKKIYRIIEVLLTVCFLILFNVRIIHTVAVLPGVNEFGENITVRTDYYHSIFENIKDGGVSVLIWIFFIATAVSIALSSTAFFLKDNKKIEVASKIAFVLSAIVFLVSLLFALALHRHY